jgi:predicted dehydrogenase
MNETAKTAASLGVGVIGCGEIAQLMHLPILKELPGLHIAALCDLSREVLDALGDGYGVAARYTDPAALLADPDVDAVVICTYDHAPLVAQVIAAGKHVVVEKPLGFTPAEAAPLVDALAASGLVGMVGYMKLYDPGYVAGLDRIRGIGRAKTVHVHDFAGRFDRYGQLYTQVRGTDVDPAKLAAVRDETNARIDATLGPDHAGYRDLYLTLLMLGSHDLAVLRGAFGKAEVVHAQPVGPSHLLAVLELADRVPAILEVAFGAQYEWWDEWMAVYGERDEVRIEFQNPYVRNASARVRLRHGADGEASETLVQAPPETAFRAQWQHFLHCVRSGEAPRTPLSGGLADLELAVSIIRAMPPRPA